MYRELKSLELHRNLNLKGNWNADQYFNEGFKQIPVTQYCICEV